MTSRVLAMQPSPTPHFLFSLPWRLLRDFGCPVWSKLRHGHVSDALFGRIRHSFLGF